MRKIRLLPFLFAVLMLSSCSQQEQLSSSNLIQKRRYTKGFHLNLKSPANQKADVATQTMAEAETRELNPTLPESHSINNNLSASLSTTEPADFTSGNKPVVSTVVSQAENTTPTSSKDMTRKEKKAFKKEVKQHFKENKESYKALKERAKVSDNVVATAPAVQGGDPPLILMLIACIIPPLPMAILYGFGWQFWVSLLLCLLFGLELFYLGGVAFIFSLIMVILYYS